MYYRSDNGLTCSCIIFCVEYCSTIHVKPVCHNSDFYKTTSFTDVVGLWIKVNFWNCTKKVIILVILEILRNYILQHCTIIVL